MKFELDNFHRDVSDDELIQDLVIADAQLKLQKTTLTFRSYNQLGRYSSSTIAARFGSWNDGLRKAGLTPIMEMNVSIESLFDNLKLVWISKGKQPVFRDMGAPPSQYSAATYSDRFGGWRKALVEFVASVEQVEIELLSYEVEVKRSKGAKRTKRDPSLALRFFIFTRDHCRCVTCGRSRETVASLVLEVDHVIPWSKGGETIAENLQLLCFDCNRGKDVS